MASYSEIPWNVRTLGDGMDNLQLESEHNVKNCLLNLKSSETKRILKSLKPIEPKSEVCYLIPKYVPKVRKQPKYLIKKMKEPKFIPYEPYKACVEPIFPNKNLYKILEHKSLPSKNNIEIQELVDQMSQMRTAELSKEKIQLLDKEESFISIKQWQKEKTAYETDIKNLRETNSHLENQLKLQSQVNSELKTLLVAAVGEDLETRVQHLTEDKLQLARALLNSANHLTSHQEQYEWLSGQCEVWRSKFLASSLMVEELARWKSALSSRISDLQETIKLLLEDRILVQKLGFDVNSNLNKASNYLSKDSPKELFKLKSANIIDVNKVNLKLSEAIVKGFDCKDSPLIDDMRKLEIYTNSEKAAIKLLQNPVYVTNKQEAVCNALLDAAVSCGQQMYLQYPSVHTTCCAHCTGEVKHI